MTVDRCGCGEDRFDFPPITNRPGLPALQYRLGTHATFFKWLLERLASYPALGDLTARSLDDPAIALLDAWAVLADVLTFYQERIANEGFLRTATERRSVLELARSIGYALSPGVAASTVLAFTVEDAVGAPTQAQVPKGTKVQSFPAQGKLPQTFETSETIQAQAAWNALRPRLTQPLAIDANSTLLYLSGVSANVKAGDLVLLVIEGTPTVKRVVKASVDIPGDRTRLELAVGVITPSFSVPTFMASDFATVTLTPVPFTTTNVTTHILQKTWYDRDLVTFLTLNKWDSTKLQKQLAALVANPSIAQSFIFRTMVSCFGHNAPQWDTLPKLPAANQGRGFVDPYLTSWDSNPPSVTQNSQGIAYTPVPKVYLERSVPEVVKASWAVFQAAGVNDLAVTITQVNEASLADFGISGKTTGLTVPTTTDLSAFKVRKTVVAVQSEALPILFDRYPGPTATLVPIETELAIGTHRLMLGQLVLGLRIGQVVVLTGDRTDTPGVRGSEILTIKEILHDRGYTILEFALGTQHRYQPRSITLNANAVRATHGETCHEILGSGQGNLAHQQFILHKPPLTYTSAATATGRQSSLELRVNQILWSEAPSLYGLGPRDEQYIVRIDHDSNPTITFGDGRGGARLPSGLEQVMATYRTGIGLDGLVEAGSLSLLQTRPQGIREVTNPLAAVGAAAPEQLENARTNAPLQVRTLDRIVSLTDFEDFAQAFPGIGKAQAIPLFTGERRLVYLTIAGVDGAEITPGSDLYLNLLKAMDQARDPVQGVQVASYTPLYFQLVVRIKVDARYLKDLVCTAVAAALKSAFSFANRTFGQVVTAAEVMHVIHQVPGVVAVDLDDLYLPPASSGLNQVLPATLAHWQASTQTIVPAQLLLINPVGITLLEMQS